MRNWMLAFGIILTALPCAGAEVVSDSLQKAIEQPLYSFEATGKDGYRADNAKECLAAEFDTRETRLQHPHGSVAFRLLGYGYGPHLTSPAATRPSGTADRVEYRRGDITEWYKNGA